MAKRKPANPNNKVVAQCSECRYILMYDADKDAVKRLKSIVVFPKAEQKVCGVCKKED